MKMRRRHVNSQEMFVNNPLRNINIGSPRTAAMKNPIPTIPQRARLINSTVSRRNDCDLMVVSRTSGSRPSRFERQRRVFPKIPHGAADSTEYYRAEYIKKAIDMSPAKNPTSARIITALLIISGVSWFETSSK
jgi:hypothetical protein